MDVTVTRQNAETWTPPLAPYLTERKKNYPKNVQLHHSWIYCKNYNINKINKIMWFICIFCSLWAFCFDKWILLTYSLGNTVDTLTGESFLLVSYLIFLRKDRYFKMWVDSDVVLSGFLSTNTLLFHKYFLFLTFYHGFIFVGVFVKSGFSSKTMYKWI